MNEPEDREEEQPEPAIKADCGGQACTDRLAALVRRNRDLEARRFAKDEAEDLPPPGPAPPTSESRVLVGTDGTVRLEIATGMSPEEAVKLAQWLLQSAQSAAAKRAGIPPTRKN